MRMKNKAFFLIILLCSLSSHAKSIYSKYQTTPEFAKFDEVINQARLPSSDVSRNKVNITHLKAAIKKYSNYPKLDSAHFFLGRCNFKLKNYRTAIKNYNTALGINPLLKKSTPIERFIASMEATVSRQNSIILGLILLCPWLLVILVLLTKSIKRRLIGKKQVFGVILGVLLATGVTIVWFSFSTSSSADGFKDLYVTPVFVRSTIFDKGSYPLVVLAIFALVTSFLTALAALGSMVLSKFRFLFPLLTAIVIGPSASLLYYQYYGLDGDRTGTGTFKRISFPERPIDFHRDIPDEMIHLYDAKVQELIRKAKLEAKAEAASQNNK